MKPVIRPHACTVRHTGIRCNKAYEESRVDYMFVGGCKLLCRAQHWRCWYCGSVEHLSWSAIMHVSCIIGELIGFNIQRRNKCKCVIFVNRNVKCDVFVTLINKTIGITVKYLKLIAHSFSHAIFRSNPLLLRI